MSDDGTSIREIRSALREAGDPWTAGETTMSALPPEEQQRRLGVTPPPGEPSIEEVAHALRARPAHEAFIAAAAVGAPPSYDLRNVGGKNFVTAVKDQGGCGSCVAFGVSAVLETTLKVARQDPALAVDLSEAQLFYCYGRSQGRNCGNGWFPDAALDCVQNGGLAFEQSYPYVAGDQNCTGLNPDWKSRYVSLGGRQGPLRGAAIKEWIATRGPVTGCFIVYEDFFSYRSGVYRHVSGAQRGGHCVTLIGYDDTQNCWIAKNSWGTGWGENGFFRIAYGECGIDTWLGPYGAANVALVESSKAWSNWASRGGVLRSNVAVGQNRDGRLEVFVRGSDSALYHQWQLARNGGWSGWASLGGVLTSDIAVGRNRDGRLESFGRGTDNALYHKWQVTAGGGWSGWTSLGGVLTSNPTVASNADGRLEAFVRGSNNALYHKWQVAPNGSWSGWTSLGGVLTSDIAAARNADGRLEVFVRGTDNALYHMWQLSPNGGWSGWASLGGVLTSRIAVSSNADGRLEVFVRGTDNALYHKWQVTPSGSWSGWASLGGVLTSDIAVGRNASGRLEVFVRGTDNALYHKWQVTPNGAWSGWASLGGALTSNPAVASNADGRLEVFVRGTDGALYHKWQGAPALIPSAEESAEPSTSDAMKSARDNGEMPRGEMMPDQAQGGEMPKGDMQAAEVPEGAGMPEGAMTALDTKSKEEMPAGTMAAVSKKRAGNGARRRESYGPPTTDHVDRNTPVDALSGGDQE